MVTIHNVNIKLVIMFIFYTHKNKWLFILLCFYKIYLYFISGLDQNLRQINQ